eukprot:gene827-919_t
MLEDINSGKNKEVSSSKSPSNSGPVDQAAAKRALSGIGNWEKHTKGIGKKLLEKFGFTGRLGAKETGITAAIEVKVRPERSLYENTKKQQLVSRKLKIIESEIESTDNMLQADSGQLNRMRQLTAVFERVLDRMENSVDKINVGDIANMLVTVQSKFREEFKLFGVIHSLPCLITPVIRNELLNWNPIDDADILTDLYSSWFPFLDALEDANDKVIAEQLLQRSFETVVLPAVRSHLVNQWRPREQPWGAVKLMERLKPMTSPSAFELLSSSILLPKLTQEVQEWSPTTDSIPINSWLHPWLGLLGSSLSAVYPEIRRKLSAALKHWHPSDPSARVILLPWHGVFDQTSFGQLLVRCVVPKLIEYMRGYVINPALQDLEPFHNLMSWSQLIPRTHFLSLIEGEFLPKWLLVLFQWLTAPSPDFEEITNWYLGWKSQFPSDLLRDPALESCFNQALELMNQVLLSEPGTLLNLPASLAQPCTYYTVLERRQRLLIAENRLQELQRPKVYPTQGNGLSGGISFKDVVESFAESHGVIFMPREGKMHDGKQVYQFGNRLCYFDMNVVFVHQNNGARGVSWDPIGLEDLLLVCR